MKVIGEKGLDYKVFINLAVVISLFQALPVLHPVSALKAL